MRRLLACAVVVASAFAATTVPFASPAVAARSGSIVYIKDHNVWLMSADTHTKVQVTRDGTASNPYAGPSQSDAGIISAAQGEQIVLLDQNGRQLNRFAAPLVFDFGILDTDISPNGQRIAYWTEFIDCSSGTCYQGEWSVVVGSNGAVVDDDNGDFSANPEWVSDTRLLTDDGYSAETWSNPGTGSSPQDWFNYCSDTNNSDFCFFTDYSDPDVSPSGARMAVALNDGVEMYIYSGVTVGGGRTLKCRFFDPAGYFGDPTWSPDGSAFAWEEADLGGGASGDNQGVWISDVSGLESTTTCGGVFTVSLVVPGGTDPDWSPAPIDLANEVGFNARTLLFIGATGSANVVTASQPLTSGTITIVDTSNEIIAYSPCRGVSGDPHRARCTAKQTKKVHLVGNDLDDRLTTKLLQPTILDGGGGADTLVGGRARDTFRGGGGNDTIRARDGIAETVDCGAGTDGGTADRDDRLTACENVAKG